MHATRDATYTLGYARGCLFESASSDSSLYRRAWWFLWLRLQIYSEWTPSMCERFLILRCSRSIVTSPLSAPGTKHIYNIRLPSRWHDASAIQMVFRPSLQHWKPFANKFIFGHLSFLPMINLTFHSYKSIHQSSYFHSQRNNSNDFTPFAFTRKPSIDWLWEVCDVIITCKVISIGWCVG